MAIARLGLESTLKSQGLPHFAYFATCGLPF